MTKGEKDYSQSEQGGVSQPGQENSQQRNCMSVAQTYWVIDLLSQNKWNGTRVFWFLIPKSLVSLGVSVSTCIQYYFKGFSLKTVSTPNQIAGWERETFCLLITLPTTCLRGASFPKDPATWLFFPLLLFLLCLLAANAMHPWLSESQRVLYVLWLWSNIDLDSNLASTDCW